MDSMEELFFPSATKECDIYAKIWKPFGGVRCVLQFAHGMAEHIQRYDGFAHFLNQYGIVFAANDHAGHGKSLADPQHKGFFCGNNGWSAAVEDLRTFHKKLAEAFPDCPHFHMGHSMGSFLARTYAARYHDGFSGFVFCGTAGKNPAIKLGTLVAKGEIRRNGPMQPSKRLEKLGFGTYNKQFSPRRTDFDWLSRDMAQVDRYVADPLCGFTFTAEGMLDIFNGLSEISSTKWAVKVPTVPILLISGDQDPVGANGKGVRQVHDWLVKTGHTVTMHLYPQGRHEILNETNQQEVYQDVLAFINETVSKA